MAKGIFRASGKPWSAPSRAQNRGDLHGLAVFASDGRISPSRVPLARNQHLLRELYHFKYETVRKSILNVTMLHRRKRWPWKRIYSGVPELTTTHSQQSIIHQRSPQLTIGSKATTVQSRLRTTPTTLHEHQHACFKHPRSRRRCTCLYRPSRGAC